MPPFDPAADDRRKVVPIGTYQDHYTPGPDDLPYEAWEAPAPPGGFKFKGKSGAGHGVQVPLALKIPVESDDGRPLANELFRLILPSGRVILAETDGQGLLKALVDEPGPLTLLLENRRAPITIDIE
jgi:hypothetical protein